MRVAVLGTGIMGAAMARSLARERHEVTVWNRTPERAVAAAGDRITACGGVADALLGAEVVYTMLYDADSVVDVTAEIVGSLGEGAVWAQSTTVGPAGMHRIADAAELAREGIHNFFAHCAEHAQREFRQLMQRGRVSLLIGLAFLTACLLIADAVAKIGGGTFITIVRESFIIGGWVAMWRPLEIFLYDWWPLRQRRRVYEKLARADVRVLGAAA